MSDWNRNESWRKLGKNFLVEVRRHEEATPEHGHRYDSEGPHRWCVYAYVYPKHPMFDGFDASKDMWDQPSMPGHYYVSLYRPHMDVKTLKITSHQLGWDYHHDHDERFTFMATPEDAREVFEDAQVLFDFLQAEGMKEAA